MGFADDRGLGDFLMIDQRALDFHRADAMAGHVHHVVDPAEQPEITVLVALAAVAGKIFSRKAAPVSLHETVGIAVDRPHHRRPRFSQNQITAAAFGNRLAALIDDVGFDAGQRHGRRAGF